MISFTDVLHDLVRRGLTLRIDQAGNLFIYDPQHTGHEGAAKAETPAASKDHVPANTARHTNGGRMQTRDPLPDGDGGMSARHAAALAARCRMPVPPAAGGPAPQPPGPQWRGITWRDVPGHDESVQKLNFALLKRGMLRGHKCCRSLEGAALKDRLQELSQRNRENSQVCKENARLRHQSNPRPKPP
ncbi:hypothetical protein [Prosthecobacter sp.]|uniref:hypothetical protein n=1 Tax=Prosthecobacter sp. TaxID=1965333 RepID=UPI002487A0BD|nr:hypothetical protein [Prosthecobacter sp.]MDI1313809.1 hypothetical protein [Prosthecobacter sp.]